MNTPITLALWAPVSAWSPLLGNPLPDDTATALAGEKSPPPS